MMRTKTASKRRLMRYACAGGRDKEIRQGAERSLQSKKTRGEQARRDRDEDGVERSLQRRLEASKRGEIER